MKLLLLLSVTAACYTPTGDTIETPAHSAPYAPVWKARLPSSSGLSGKREARAVLAAYDAACASNPGGSCGVHAWHPCDPPRPFPLPGSLTPDDAPSAKHGKVFFDGSACYEVTAAREGPCAWLHRCQPWTTLEACEASRAICTERGR